MDTETDVSLVELGIPRDQGSRPTCLSFAISDVHRARITLDEHLSPESLHRAAATRGGTDVRQPVSSLWALAALKVIGQTTEANWPYNSPVCSKAGVIYHKRPGTHVGFDADAVASELAAKIPTVIILDIGEEFFSCLGVNPLEAHDACPAEACHAVVLTGVKRIEGQHYFRLRNSWGFGWGNQGQVWASNSYLLARSPSIVRID